MWVEWQGAKTSKNLAAVLRQFQWFFPLKTTMFLFPPGERAEEGGSLQGEDPRCTFARTSEPLSLT